jgi:hypothetical protein
LAEKHQIELGDWFVSPLHPVQQNFELWELNTELFLNAIYVGKHIINLPTDTKDVSRILNFLQKIDNNIIEI